MWVTVSFQKCQPLRRKSIYGSVGGLSLMFITSRNFSQLRESISLADAERNNPEVILIGCRKHPEMIRRQSNYHCTTCGKRGADVRLARRTICGVPTL
jgi:hypothetical protein